MRSFRLAAPTWRSLSGCRVPTPRDAHPGVKPCAPLRDLHWFDLTLDRRAELTLCEMEIALGKLRGQCLIALILISRNSTLPPPVLYCSPTTPEECFESWPSRIFLPFNTTTKWSPSAVIS